MDCLQEVNMDCLQDSKHGLFTGQLTWTVYRTVNMDCLQDSKHGLFTGQ